MIEPWHSILAWLPAVVAILITFWPQRKKHCQICACELGELPEGRHVVMHVRTEEQTKLLQRIAMRADTDEIDILNRSVNFFADCVEVERSGGKVVRQNADGSQDRMQVFLSH